MKSDWNLDCIFEQVQQPLACLPLDFFLSEIMTKLLIFMSHTHEHTYALFIFIACTYFIAYTQFY